MGPLVLGGLPGKKHSGGGGNGDVKRDLRPHSWRCSGHPWRYLWPHVEYGMELGSTTCKTCDFPAVLSSSSISQLLAFCLRLRDTGDELML